MIVQHAEDDEASVIVVRLWSDRAGHADVKARVIEVSLDDRPDREVVRVGRAAILDELDAAVRRFETRLARQD